MSALALLKRHLDEQRVASAKASQRCVVVVGTTTRERGRTDANPNAYRPADVMTCLHSVSYTMSCTKCRRTKQDAAARVAKLKLMLSIT
jgi:hypothetical protein